jgi:hypothetical protein
MSERTVGLYYKTFREVCMADELEFQKTFQLGGPGIIVEMDESKFGKRKYNKGHRVEGNWVWGCIERIVDRDTGACTAGRSVMVVVPNRWATTLKPLITRFIMPGSYIISDKFSSYHRVKNYRTLGAGMSDEEYQRFFGYLNDPRPNPFCNNRMYKHDMVNHSKGYKDPRTGAHTNTIEGHWRVAKLRIPNQLYYDKAALQEYLYEMAWEARRKDTVGRFYGFLDSLRAVRMNEEKDMH